MVWSGFQNTSHAIRKKAVKISFATLRSFPLLYCRMEDGWVVDIIEGSPQSTRNR